MSTNLPSGELNWLPQTDRDWCLRHQRVLEVIFDAFAVEGKWPDPVALERTTRAGGEKLGIGVALQDLPASVGHRSYSPAEVSLSLFGLACVPAARWLLDSYVAVLRLALDRFDAPELPCRLSRGDVEAHLQLSGPDMDLLSVVLMGPGNIILGGGNSGLADWSRDIDARIVRYEHVTTADDLVETVAADRLAVVPMDAAQSSESVDAQRTGTRGDLTLGQRAGKAEQGTPVSIATALGLAVGVCANLLGLMLAPLPFAVGASVATIVTGILHRRIVRSNPSLLAIGVAIAAGAIAAGATLAIQTVTRDSRPSTASGESGEEQLDRVLQTAAREKRRVVFRASAHMHGPGGPEAQIIVLRDDRVKEHPPGDIPIDAHGRSSAPGSDEVRVYDLVQGRLSLRFRFLPQGPGQVRQLPEGDYPTFRFRATPPRDRDGDGRPELVGSFDRVTLASGPYPVPVSLSWDDGAQRYQLAPLIPNPPKIRVPEGQARLLGGYTHATTIKDRYSGAILRGHAVDAFGLFGREPDVIVAAAYADPVAVAANRAGYYVQAWLLDFQAGPPVALECFSEAQRVTPVRADDAPNDVVRTWLPRYAVPPCEL